LGLSFPCEVCVENVGKFRSRSSLSGFGVEVEWISRNGWSELVGRVGRLTFDGVCEGL